MQKIFIGNDHAGPEFVQDIISHIKESGYDVEHVGSFGSKSVDYPEYAEATARKVVENEGSLGIVICGTGIGISIAANKVQGIRCANCISPYMAELSRQHNNANVLALGARIVDVENAKIIVDTFLRTEFEGGRHQKRIEKIDAIKR